MKNKFTRFLCFFLCFCLCFAYFGETQKAEAAGVGLAGIVLMYLLGCGFGFSVSGASTHLAEGISQLVEAYETNEFNGELDFWDVLSIGTTIGSSGEALLNKAAVELMNGFLDWLQSDKGWSAGSEQVVANSFYQVPSSIGQINYNGKTENIRLCTDNNGNVLYRGTYASGSWGLQTPSALGTFVPYDDTFSFVKGSDSSVTLSSTEVWYYDSSSGKLVLKRGTAGSGIETMMTKMGYSVEDFIGITFVLHGGVSGSSVSYRNVAPALVFSDGKILIYNEGDIFKIRSSSYDSLFECIDNEYTISIPSDLAAPDTSDWDAATSLGLFTGHSGKIPTSVEEYNDLVLQDVNSGVIPEVTTDVIVGTPDQVLPDEEDGTLAGTVSGILAQVMALPQTLANLVLDGVKSIFIPDPANLETAFMGLLEEVNDVYEFDFDLGALFAEGKPPDDITATYHVGSKDIKMTFVSWHFLKDAVIDLRKYIRGFIVVLLAFFNLRQFMALLNAASLESGTVAPAPESSTSIVVSNRR